MREVAAMRFRRAATMLIGLILLWAVPAWAEQAVVTFVWPTYTASKVRYGEELVRQFEEAHPNIDIDLVLASDPYERLTVLVAAGTPPDVVWLGAGWHQFIGLFMPLDGFVARDAAEIDVQDFLPPVWNVHIWEGVRYALPTGYQTLAGFYNKDRYNQAGRAYPTDEWTVDQMIDDARAMTVDSNGDGTPDRWGVSWLYGYVWSFVHYGGPVADPTWTEIRINNPVTARALSLWNGLPWDFQVAPPNHGNLSMIENGDIGIFASGIWLQENLTQSGNFDFDYVDYPWLVVGGERHRGTIIYPEELAILKDTDVPEEAWTFLKFATGREHLTWAAQEGHIVPARLSILTSDIFQRPDKRMQVWYTSAEYAHELLPHPTYNNLLAVFNEHWRRMAGASPSLSIEAGLELMQSQMQAVLDEYNARTRN